MNQQSSYPWQAWLILSGLALIWGSSFILIKKSLQVYSPLQVASLRVFFGFLTLMPGAFISWKYIPFSKWKYLLVAGCLGVLFPAFLFAFAQTKVNSSLEGILNSLTPLFALLAGVIFFGQRGSLSKYLGVGLGFLGTVLLTTMNHEEKLLSFNSYALLVVAAAMMYGLNVNFIKHYLSQFRPLHISTLSLCTMGPFATLSVLSLDVPSTFQSTPGSAEALLYLAILGCLSTGLATMFFYRLLQMTNPLFASSVTYIIPIVAVGWGVLDGEQLRGIQVMSMVLIIVGVWIVNRR